MGGKNGENPGKSSGLPSSSGKPAMKGVGETRDGDAGGNWVHGVVIVLAYACAIGASGVALYRVPQPLPLDAPPGSFSEARAFKTAQHLSEQIGARMVGTPGVELAAQYLLERCNALKDLAERTRPDLVVQVDREQVSGAAHLVFVGVSIANAYRNLTNVVLRIAPRDANATKGVLVNAHYDSVFGTTGASDCAGCVAVSLEVARAIVADPTKVLAAPALFLFNGGEELVLLGAHGFMNQSRHARDLGAFINLESTGPGGPDVVFQAAGSWPVEAYARVAAIPRGSVLGQDMFDTRVLSMDTDFRMFSYRHKGTLPGIDIAQVMDGSAYHTKNDNFARIRKGTLQACGENIMALLVEMGRELKKQERTPLPELDADGSVYVDFLSLFLVHYPAKLGKALHSAPLLMLAGGAALMGARPGNPQGGPTWGFTKAVITAFASLVCACLLPVGLGILRVLISDVPLAWFSRLSGAYAVAVPAALAGLLLPYAVTPPGPGGPDVRTCVFATTLIQSALGALVSALGGKSAFGCAAWGFAGLLSLLVPSSVPRGWQLAWALLTAAPAALVDAPMMTTLPLFVMEHLSLAGARGPMWAGDAVAGGLLGFAVVMTTGFMAPWLADRFRRGLKGLVVLLLLTSVAAATWVSISGNPYSEEHVKRIMLQHLHRLGPDGNVVESRWVVGGLDMTPIERVLPLGIAVNASEDRDFQALYPITRLLRAVTFPAPRPDKPTFQYKKIGVVLVEQYMRSGTARAHLEIRLPRPGWGALNVSGPVVAWSFTGELPLSPQEGGAVSHVTRFAGNEGAQVWPFWVDMQGPGALRVELSVLFHDRTPAIRDMEARFPTWTSTSSFTTFQGAWEF